MKEKKVAAETKVKSLSAFNKGHYNKNTGFFINNF